MDLRRDGREPETTSTVAGAPGTEVPVVASSSALRSTASATQRAMSSAAAGASGAWASAAGASGAPASETETESSSTVVSSDARTGAGWYSATTTCALVPPNPNPEMPARARPL